MAGLDGNRGCIPSIPQGVVVAFKSKSGTATHRWFRSVVEATRVTDDYVVYHRRVIELVAQGFTNKEVASELGTTENIINFRTIYDTLGFSNRVEV